MSDPRAIVAVLTEHAANLSQTYVELAQAAHAAGDHELGLRYFDAFDRGFRSVRLGLNLDLRLQKPVRPAAPEALSDRGEDEREEVLEVERPERLEYTERDRDRDEERASFPLLLKSLGGLVAGAERLPGPQPAELVSLKELLATVGAPPKAQSSPLKARLAGSAAAPVATLDRPRPISGLSLPPRRATGPPKR